MAAVGLVLHHAREKATALALDLADWLTAAGHEARMPFPDADLAGRPALGAGDAEFATGLDVVVSLGGDGTMLRAVDLVADHGVPVAGVNVGHLGYLTGIEPEAARTAVERVLAGDHEVEERMLLAVTVERDGRRGPTRAALNEVVVEKTSMGHMVRLAVEVDGAFFTTYAADGLIVATPTGSTAYALSARGPIIAPTHRALLLTPVSPHMLFDRPLVLGPENVLRLEVRSPRPATANLDGRNLGELADGDAVICTAHDRSARLVTFRDRDFLGILKAKFGLNER